MNNAGDSFLIFLCVPLQDEVIIQQGDLGDFFYVLDSGHCDIFVNGVGKVSGFVFGLQIN